jgi:raffinose/stachyose/melibiose transport system permease protein
MDNDLRSSYIDADNREHKSRSQKKKETRTLFHNIYRYRYCYLFLFPTFLLLFTFNYIPVFSAFSHSLFTWNGANVEIYTGFDNFKGLLSDRNFKLAMSNVGKITLLRLAIFLTAPLLGAILISRLKNKSTAQFFKVVFVIPMVVPTMVIFLIWKFFYMMPGGVINEFLRVIGLIEMQTPWLGSVDTALLAVIFVGFPWISGFQMLIYLAGIQGISESIIESAFIDGANSFVRFFRIELPLIVPQIKLVSILAIIQTVQGFTDIMVLTGGGPGKTTMVPGLLLYRTAMQYGRMGYACSMGVVLFVIILGLTYLNLKYVSNETE